MPKNIIEPGGLLSANLELARHLQTWLERSGEAATGVICIGLRANGFELQYMGSEQLDARQLENRVLWIADQIRRLQT